MLINKTIFHSNYTLTCLVPGMSFISALNDFCKFIYSKNNDYINNINGHCIGSYKSHHKTSWETLKAKSQTDPTVNLTKFMYEIFSDPDIAIDHFSSFTSLFIQQIAVTNPRLGNFSIFDNSQLELFKKLKKEMDDQWTSLNIENPFASSPIVINNNHNLNSNASLSSNVNTGLESSDNSSNNLLQDPNSSSQFFRNLENLFKRLETLENGFGEKIEQLIHDKITTEFSKHLGIDKNLSSDQIVQFTNKLEFTHKSMIRNDNHIKILQTHLDNRTTPASLSFQRFPKPYRPFSQNFVDKSNEIYSKCQVDLLKLGIEDLQQENSILNNDVKVFKDILKHHVPNINDISNSLFKKQEELQKDSMKKAHDRCLKSKSTPFSVAKKSSFSNNKIDKNKSKKNLSANKTTNNNDRSNNSSNKPNSNTNTTSYSNNYNNINKNKNKNFKSLNYNNSNKDTNISRNNSLNNQHKNLNSRHNLTNNNNSYQSRQPNLHNNNNSNNSNNSNRFNYQQNNQTTNSNNFQSNVNFRARSLPRSNN